eukprot:355898-Chlamydomonas_euryale.AAC.1
MGMAFFDSRSPERRPVPAPAPAPALVPPHSSWRAAAAACFCCASLFFSMKRITSGGSEGCAVICRITSAASSPSRSTPPLIWRAMDAAATAAAPPWRAAATGTKPTPAGRERPPGRRHLTARNACGGCSVNVTSFPHYSNSVSHFPAETTIHTNRANQPKRGCPPSLTPRTCVHTD